MAIELREQMDLAKLYETDFYAWAKHQAEALRQFQATRPNAPIDFAHLVEEVEDLARRDVRAAKSQLRRLILHVLKLEYSPADCPRRQWLNSVDDARQELDDVLSPSVVAIVTPLLPKLFAEARRAGRRARSPRCRRHRDCRIPARELALHPRPAARRNLAPDQPPRPRRRAVLR